MRFDLHIHSTASDGALTPSEVARAAATGGLHVIALTDHDTTAGVDEAAAAAAAAGLDLITGCELSSTFEGRDIHVLGYGIDARAPAMRDHERRASSRRRDRMAEMVDRLADLGIHVRLERVLEIAGSVGVVGRPHLARALVEEGHARSVPEAFDTLIGDRHAAFVPTALHTPHDVIRTIRAAGGVAVWAHPPGDLLADLLPGLAAAGLQGVEAHRPRASNRDRQRLLRLAREGGLVVSGGSDWHDPDRNEPLGAFWVDEDQVAGLMGLLEG